VAVRSQHAVKRELVELLRKHPVVKIDCEVPAQLDGQSEFFGILRNCGKRLRNLAIYTDSKDVQILDRIRFLEAHTTGVYFLQTLDSIAVDQFSRVMQCSTERQMRRANSNMTNRSRSRQLS
jgi:hypothetical protein